MHYGILTNMPYSNIPTCCHVLENVNWCVILKVRLANKANKRGKVKVNKSIVKDVAVILIYESIIQVYNNAMNLSKMCISRWKYLYHKMKHIKKGMYPPRFIRSPPPTLYWNRRSSLQSLTFVGPLWNQYWLFSVSQKPVFGW